MKLGATDISKVYLGSTEVTKAYFGDALVHGNLLPYDAEVEYLESTGTQYIDTGLYGSDDLTTTLTFQLSSTSASRGVFGVYESNKNCYVYQSSTNYWQVGFGSYGNTSIQTNTNKHTMVFGNNSVALDGTTIFTGSGSSFTSTQTLVLFNMHNGSGGTYNATGMKVFGAKFEKNGVTVMDLIPVRKNGIGYMYDKVSGELLGNSGTGDFTISWDAIYSPIVNLYNTNKLVFFLDGIAKGGSNSAWTDLVRRLSFDYTEHSTALTNGVSFDGLGCITANADYLGIHHIFGTIEVVYSQKNSGGIVMMAPNSDYLSYLFGGNGITFMPYAADNQYITTHPTTATCSINDDLAVLNGVKLTGGKERNNWTDNNTRMTLGGRTGSSYAKIIIHAIRLYNRKLTQEEMLQNQAVDNERFNLGLTINNSSI